MSNNANLIDYDQGAPNGDKTVAIFGGGRRTGKNEAFAREVQKHIDAVHLVYLTSKDGMEKIVMEKIVGTVPCPNTKLMGES